MLLWIPPEVRSWEPVSTTEINGEAVAEGWTVSVVYQMYLQRYTRCTGRSIPDVPVEVYQMYLQRYTRCTCRSIPDVLAEVYQIYLQKYTRCTCRGIPGEPAGVYQMYLQRSYEVMTMRKTGGVWWPCAQTMLNLGNYQNWGKDSKKTIIQLITL